MQESINNHINLLKEISSAEDAKNYDEAKAKVSESDNKITKIIREFEESIK
jgi:hypothetical protein